MTASSGILMHSMLCRRGGAARVATLLHNELCAPEMPYRVVRSTEYDDSDPLLPEEGQCQCITTAPARSLFSEPCDVLHLHSTCDWQRLLSDAQRFPQVVITLHDASLLTGGCPFPLACSGWKDGCSDPCPRGYPYAAARQAALRGALEKLCAVSAVQMVSPSLWLKKMAGQAVPGIPCHVIPNGVEDTFFTEGKNAARKRLGIAATARVILMLAHGGQQAAYKAGEQWEGLWRSVRSRRDIICIMAGGDSCRTEERLLVLPYLDRRHLSLVLTAADLLVYPTLADNHPLVVLEAFSAGTPVVAFAEGGVPEQIDRQTGRLVQPGNWPAMTEQILQLTADRTGLKKMGEAARTCWLNRFTARRMAQDYVRLYHRHGQSAE